MDTNTVLLHLLVVLAAAKVAALDRTGRVAASAGRS
jgi:hypothetical protein